MLKSIVDRWKGIARNEKTEKKKKKKEEEGTRINEDGRCCFRSKMSACSQLK